MKCTATVLWLLLTASNRGGSGEAYDHPLIGRWAGDRIAVIGGGAKPDDVPGVNAAQIMELHAAGERSLKATWATRQ
jgi:hypothetical protein